MEKVISFCGEERGAFVYYIAVILAKAGYATLVIDNSNANDIYKAVSDYDESADYVVKQSITYVENMRFHKNDDSFYDYVLIWHGMNVDEKELAQSDHVFVMPTYSPISFMSLNNMIKDKSLITAVYMRDATEATKVTNEDIARYFDIPVEKIVCVMTYDEKDYENYISFIYNGRQTFANLSPNYNAALKYTIACILEETDKKNINKLFNTSKKTKNM